MNFLPHFPLNINPAALFGITLLLGLIGGQLAKLSRFLPVISGYIAVGYVFGPHGFNITTPSLLSTTSIFVDIALGLILFDLGRHLDFHWLKKDCSLLFMSLTESTLTFASIFTLLYFFKFNWLSSALAATIAVATSPAVVMMVAHDISAEGPVTRRTLILTSLNNLFALIIFTILLPVTHIASSPIQVLSEHISYRLFGSVALGILMYGLLNLLARLLGKNKENQLILMVSTVILSIGLTMALNLSTLLALFTIGVAARNFDKENFIMEIDFGFLLRLFFILLFVVTGVYLKLDGLWQATALVLAFITIKITAKFTGVLLFSRPGRLTNSQTIALGFTLMPMAELAIGMSNKLIYFNPDFSQRLLTIISAVVAIFYIIGPIAVQFAFVKSGETAS